jgi:2-dehydro-3-deoxygalactonokinase
MSNRYLIGDWGTTHLRLYLIEQGQVTSVREGAGIGGLTTPPADVLRDVVIPWLGASPIDVVLCGMASSRSGLYELPYVQAPADFQSWAQRVHRSQQGSLSILLTTGMKCNLEPEGFDVMRGEEAQIFGALHIEPALISGSHCLILPGTHSKWVTLQEGSIQHFRTALTGELYALLRNHSTLLKVTADDAGLEFDQGFKAGSARSLQMDDGLLAAAFQTRTAQLLAGRSAAWASGFLSGLLIGHELATLSKQFTTVNPVTLIGDHKLTTLYQRILTERGITTRLIDGAACVLASLQHLHERYDDLASRAP